MNGKIVSMVEVGIDRDGRIMMVTTSGDTVTVAKMHPDDARAIAAMLTEACDHLMASLN